LKVVADTEGDTDNIGVGDAAVGDATSTLDGDGELDEEQAATRIKPRNRTPTRVLAPIIPPFVNTYTA
jgi:hypothetical protein